MRIHIAIVGINRSLRFTAHTISHRLARPLDKFPGIALSMSLTLIKPPGNIVSNPRSGEVGGLDNFLPDFIHKDDVVECEQEVLDEEIRDRFAFFPSLADPWEDGKGSLRNFFRFLLALEKTYTNVISPVQPDIVIFLRPDLLVVDRLYLAPRLVQLRLLTLLNKGAAIFPAWGRQRGLNDRFAVLSKVAAEQYFLRANYLTKPFFDQLLPNSESFLKHAMKDIHVSNSIHSRMPRVRLGGEIAHRDKPMMRTSKFSFRRSIYRARLRRFRRRSISVLRHFLWSKDYP